MNIPRVVTNLGKVGVLIIASAAAPAYADVANVTIVHFNDLDRMGERDGRGGVARLASVIESERQMGGQVIVTFGGDTISPSLLSGMDEGAHMIDLLNQIGVTAMAIGNHEFDFGPEIAEERIAEANFPMLGANHANPDGDMAPVPTSCTGSGASRRRWKKRWRCSRSGTGPSSSSGSWRSGPTKRSRRSRTSTWARSRAG